MATRRHRPNERDPHLQSVGTPAQEDEADILEEVGGERDDGGELLVDEETVQAVGAVDATSVRENRRMERALSKKRGGVKGVVFNTDDLLTKYEQVIKDWPPNTLDITVTRLTGSAVMHTIISRPRSGVELYQAIKELHGQHEEAQYAVKFLDTTLRQYRGTGRITMPDTRPAGQQGQQPMYPPNGAPPPGYQQTSGYAQAPPGYPPQQVVPGPPQQVAQPATDPIAMMRQMFDMFQTMAQRPPPPAPGPSVPVPQVNSTDPMVMMRQMFELFQQTQGGAVPPPAPQPVVIAPPPSPPQPVIDPLAMMTQMFELFTKMQASMTPRQVPGPRPPYYPQGERGEAPPSFRPQYQGREGQPPPTPQRQLSAAEQFRESMGVVRSAVSVVEEMRSMLPGQEQETHALPDDDDESPVRVIDTGPAKLVVDKADGRMRVWETGMANMDKIFKWVGEQHEVIQKANADRRQPPRQQLPPGYVEVGPDYKPPPGYRAVPVEQSDLPPPPENVPPPVQSSPRAAWGAPTIPDEQNEN